MVREFTQLRVALDRRLIDLRGLLGYNVRVLSPFAAMESHANH